MVTEAQIENLVHKQDIRDVLMRYCRAIDRVDSELLESVYHPGAEDDHGPIKGKIPAIIPDILGGLQKLSTTSFHSLSNILIEVEGDVANSESYVTAWHTSPVGEEKNVWIFAGRYIDRFERREGVWKIAKRVTVLDWEYVSPPLETEMFEQSAFVRGLRSRQDAAYAE